MGLLYTAVKDGQRIEKYAAVSPGPMNSSLPVFGERNPKNVKKFDSQPQRSHQAMAISTEDLKQIVDAISQTEVFAWAKSQMEASKGKGDGEPDGDEKAEDYAADDDADDKDDTNDSDEKKEYSALPPAQNRAMWRKVPKSKRADKGRGEYDANKMEDNWDEYSKDPTGNEKYTKLARENVKLASTVAALEKRVAIETAKRIDGERLFQALGARRAFRVRSERGIRGSPLR